MQPSMKHTLTRYSKGKAYAQTTHFWPVQLKDLYHPRKQPKLSLSDLQTTAFGAVFQKLTDSSHYINKIFFFKPMNIHRQALDGDS